MCAREGIAGFGLELAGGERESRVGALTEGIDGRLVRLHGLAAQFEAASDARLARCERMLAALMRTQCGEMVDSVLCST